MSTADDLAQMLGLAAQPARSPVITQFLASITTPDGVQIAGKAAALMERGLTFGEVLIVAAEFGIAHGRDLQKAEH